MGQDKRTRPEVSEPAPARRRQGMQQHRFTVRPCDEETGRVWDVCESRGGVEPVAVATFPTRRAARASAKERNAPQVSEPAPDRRQESR